MGLHTMKFAASGWAHTKAPSAVLQTSPRLLRQRHQKFVHPVLSALPETRPYARAINNAMAVNHAARNIASGYENVR
jgi:hypothetical protein